MNIIVQMLLAETAGESLTPGKPGDVSVSEHGDLFASLFPEDAILGAAPVERVLPSAVAARPRGDALVGMFATDALPTATPEVTAPALSEGDVPLATAPDVEVDDPVEHVAPGPDQAVPDSTPPDPWPVVTDGESEATASETEATASETEGTRPAGPDFFLPATASPVAVVTVAARRAEITGVPPTPRSVPPQAAARPDGVQKPDLVPGPLLAHPGNADPKGFAYAPPAPDKDVQTRARPTGRIDIAVPVRPAPETVPYSKPELSEDGPTEKSGATDVPEAAGPAPVDRPVKVAVTPVVLPGSQGATAIESEPASGPRRFRDPAVSSDLPSPPRPAQQPSGASAADISRSNKAIPGFAPPFAADDRTEGALVTRDTLPSVSSVHPGSHHAAPGSEMRAPAGPAPDASARPVVLQVAHAITRSRSDGTVEVHLQPEELGRVRLSILSTELGHTVSVTAERPETLDLIRRHIDILAIDLRDRGFGALNFSFGGDPRHSHSGPAERRPESAEHRAPPRAGLDVNIALRPRIVDEGRLDLRM